MLRQGLITLAKAASQSYPTVLAQSGAPAASQYFLRFYAKGKHKGGVHHTDEPRGESTFDLEKFDHEMHGAIAQLEKEFSSMRSGVATPNMLDHIMVEAYGSKQAMNKVAQVLVKEPQLLNVQVYDPSITDSVVKAIQASDMGLNPQVDKNLLRIVLPK